MRSVRPYLKYIEKLQRLTSIKFDVSQSGDALYIANRPFIAIHPARLYKDALEGKGILVPDLTIEEARYCDANRISYLTGTGKLRLFTNKLVLTIDPQKISPKRRTSPKRTVSTVPPTVLLSPNGFKILDALFRLPTESVGRYKSALSFANQFSLYQPKLSGIIRAFHVRTIGELRKAITELPEDWWKLALSHNGVQRGLTPFFLAAKPHYSLLNISGRQIAEELKEWQERHNGLVPGPTDVAKGLGFLRDEDLSVWGTEEALHQLKTKFKLIPGIDKERPIWQLASPKYGLEAEAISTNWHSYVSDTRSAIFSHANNFRAVWDLGFGTERLKELQMPVLRGLLNGI